MVFRHLTPHVPRTMSPPQGTAHSRPQCGWLGQHPRCLPFSTLYIPPITTTCQCCTSTGPKEAHLPAPLAQATILSPTRCPFLPPEGAVSKHLHPALQGPLPALRTNPAPPAQLPLQHILSPNLTDSPRPAAFAPQPHQTSLGASESPCLAQHRPLLHEQSLFLFGPGYLLVALAATVFTPR